MLAILFILFASSFASLANFFVRKNLESQGKLNGYFIAGFLCSLLASLITNYSHFFHVPVSMPMLGAGAATGLLIVLLMNLTAKTLTKGPAGLTFAFQTIGSVFPALILFLTFGTAYDFTLSPLMIVGLILVVVGLFLAAKQPKETLYQWKKD